MAHESEAPFRFEFTREEMGILLGMTCGMPSKKQAIVYTKLLNAVILRGLIVDYVNGEIELKRPPPPAIYK